MKYIFICLLAVMSMSASCNQAAKSTETAGANTAPETATVANTESEPAAIVTDEKARFEKTIAKEKLSMVDFYAVWCGPCKRMAPFIDQVFEERVKDVNVLSIDAEKYASVSAPYAITAYPTLIFFKNGKEIHREVGYRDLAQLNALVDKLK